jgi:catechol-2,3-dioxygenase
MMSVVKAYDVAYARFTAPDLDRMRAFLLDFGMVEAQVENDRLFMRCYGDNPFVHVTERAAEPGFAGFGIWVTDEDDLRKLAAHDSVELEDLDAPGGGKVVRLRDPDGFIVEVIAGQEKAAPIETVLHDGWNQAGQRARPGLLRRVVQGPSHVQRLGHIVLGVSDFRTSEAWYKERFGLVTSDEIQPAPNVAIGAFMRCDRGDQPCDHHTIFLLQRPIPAGFMHAAYEVIDLDDLMTGHEHLKQASYDHQWGIGRHYLGSQVFDYWKDPWGHEIEHWTDGDRLVTADGGGLAGIPELMGVQWGMPMPPLPVEGDPA